MIKEKLLNSCLHQGNVDDRRPLKNKSFNDKIFGKIYGDKGYLGKDLFDKLFVDGIHLITRLERI